MPTRGATVEAVLRAASQRTPYCPNPSAGDEGETIAQVTVSLQRTSTPVPSIGQKVSAKNAKYGEPGPFRWDIASEYDVALSDRKIIVSAPVGNVTAKALQDMAWRALDVAANVAKGLGEPKARLLSNLKVDPKATVRLACYHLLYERYWGSDEAQEAAELALSDASPRLRLWAARHAGQPGFDTLCELVEDSEVPQRYRNEAGRALCERQFSHPDLPSILEKALEYTNTELSIARITRPAAETSPSIPIPPNPRAEGASPLHPAHDKRSGHPSKRRNPC